MAEDGLWSGGLTSGLALILNGDDKKPSSQKNRLVSYHDDFGHQSLERTLEYVFDLPYKSIESVVSSLDVNIVRSMIKPYFSNYSPCRDRQSCDQYGLCIYDQGSGNGVSIAESSICGDLRIGPSLLMESLAIFSSARANTYVWKGKWMYEVMLETAGIQQLGWATITCPFTDRMGVGDAEDSYAFDGKRVKKWNEEDEGYGQPWVVGDVIGCCIDLDEDNILFYRNGVSLGVAFVGIRKMNPGLGYFPAVSLSQGERCNLNFGARPFKYPIEGFLPLQNPPFTASRFAQLLQCLSRLLDIEHMEKASFTSVDQLRKLQRFVPLEDVFHPVAEAICQEFFAFFEQDEKATEYLSWGPFLSFLMELYGQHGPHDYMRLDKMIDVVLKYSYSNVIFQHVIRALSFGCKTSSLVLTDCPYSGSYPYLALACHLLRREELMIMWWRLSEFDFLLEGFLSWKSPNKHDLQLMMPSVWWPNSCEDVSHESSMMLTTTALSNAVNKIEEKHRELCCLVIQFIPPSTPPELPGSVFRKFLQNTILKNRGADRNMTLAGVLGNTTLISLYTVILHFLSEGFPMADICGWSKSDRDDENGNIGFLHRGGLLSFPTELFVKNDVQKIDIPRIGGSFEKLLELHPFSDQEPEVLSWEEGCMEDGETRVTHFTRQKPCCCSCYDIDFTKIYLDPVRFAPRGSGGHSSSIRERPSHVATECSTRSLNEEIEDKPSSSDVPHSQFGYRAFPHSRIVPKESNYSSEMLREEELLDVMLLLYHTGVAPNFKQASYYMSHQSQSVALLEETDRQIMERPCIEQQKRLKEARNIYREEVIDSVRQCAWYRIVLISRWKQRGMYATCMRIVQLLLIISKDDFLFSVVPEFYLEALVDCFHVLRKSDPPFVPSAIFIKQGLGSFVSFIVTHFNDPRISSADLRDLLLQSISVLVPYKEFLAVFEKNNAATHRLPKALLSAFDNRSWIPVTNILLRLCKGSGSGSGSSKHGESSSSSVIFQKLLRDVCAEDEELFAAFLNRLFNTLSWTMTEFSVSIRETYEKNQVLEFQQRKWSVIFEFSCNLARILEFCTREVPQAFLLGNDMNLRRLTELVVFTLSQMTSAIDSEFFDWSGRRHGQSTEKINRGMILAPLVDIIVNLVRIEVESDERNDVVEVLASMDCVDSVLCGLQYVMEFDWAGYSKGKIHFAKLREVEDFLTNLISRMGSRELDKSLSLQEAECDDSMCCICYTSMADSQFLPCLHRSCHGCITRHLLNCQRCFFCNATVDEVIKDEKITP